MLRYGYLIRLHFLLQLAQHFIERAGNLVGRDDERDIVDAGRQIFDIDLVLGEHVENFDEGARFARHTGLGDGDDGESLLAGDAGDEAALLRLVADGFQDHRARMVGGVGVADVERDVFLAHGEDRAFVQHLRADVAQLAQLAVGHAADGLRIVDDAGVSHQDAGDVRPVFIYVRAECRRRKRAGDIAAAAGEGLDVAVGHHAIKAGDDDPAVLGERAQRRIGDLLIDGAVELELDPPGRVNELVAEVFGHQARGEVFTARGELILADAVFHLLPQLVKFLVEAELEAAFGDDLVIAVADHGEDILARNAILNVCGAEIEQIGDLVVAGEALARRGDDDHAAGGVGVHDGLHFGELVRVGERGAAEFQNFEHGDHSSSTA